MACSPYSVAEIELACLSLWLDFARDDEGYDETIFFDMINLTGSSWRGQNDGNPTGLGLSDAIVQVGLNFPVPSELSLVGVLLFIFFSFFFFSCIAGCLLDGWATN